VEVFKKAAVAADSEVLATKYHIFEPPREPGTTAFVMLDASHFSIHTYADENIGAMDLFTCSRKDLGDALDLIMKEFQLTEANIKSIKKVPRFEAMWDREVQPKQNGEVSRPIMNPIYKF